MLMRILLTSILAGTALFVGCSTDSELIGPGADYGGSGVFTEYHANGKVKREAKYVDGMLVSVATYYPSGVEESVEHYSQGTIHSARYYFADGRTKATLVDE